MVLLLNTTYISVDLAHHETVSAKVSKGGIKVIISQLLCVCVKKKKKKKKKKRFFLSPQTVHLFHMGFFLCQNTSFLISGTKVNGIAILLNS